MCHEADCCLAPAHVPAQAVWPAPGHLRQGEHRPPHRLPQPALHTDPQSQRGHLHHRRHLQHRRAAGPVHGLHGRDHRGVPVLRGEPGGDQPDGGRYGAEPGQEGQEEGQGCHGRPGGQPVVSI